MRLLTPLIVTMMFASTVTAAENAAPPSHPSTADLDARISALEKKVSDLQNELDATRRLIPQDADKLRDQMKREMESTLGTEGGNSPQSPLKPRLGVIVAPNTPEIAKHLKNDAKSGPFVIAVAAGSPADRAGIKAGDAITSFNNKNIQTVQDLMSAVSAVSGGKVNVVVTRKGNQVGLTVDLSPREGEPENTSYPDEQKSIGG